MNKTSIIIDRFEGSFAICEVESGRYVKISRKYFPSSAREADVLIFSPDGWAVDYAATKRRKSNAKALEDELFI